MALSPSPRPLYCASTTVHAPRYHTTGRLPDLLVAYLYGLPFPAQNTSGVLAITIDLQRIAEAQRGRRSTLHRSTANNVLSLRLCWGGRRQVHVPVAHLRRVAIALCALEFATQLFADSGVVHTNLPFVILPPATLPRRPATLDP